MNFYKSSCWHNLVSYNQYKVSVVPGILVSTVEYKIRSQDCYSRNFMCECLQGNVWFAELVQLFQSGFVLTRYVPSVCSNFKWNDRGFVSFYIIDKYCWSEYSIVPKSLQNQQQGDFFYLFPKVISVCWGFNLNWPPR